MNLSRDSKRLFLKGGTMATRSKMSYPKGYKTRGKMSYKMGGKMSYPKGTKMSYRRKR